MISFSWLALSVALAKPESLPHCQKPPSMREVASPSGLDGRSPQLKYSFSRTSCASSLKEGAFGKTVNFAAMPRAPTLGELDLRSKDCEGEDV